MATVSEALASGDLAARRGRHSADLVARVALGLVTVSLLAMVGFLMTGGRALIVRSGSMEPAISTGDIAVTRPIRPGDAEVGDIITFNDPSRSGELVTHRVIRMRPHSAQVAFVTRGDANTGVEKWKVESDGRIGEFQFRVPRAGYALAWVTQPKVRGALIGLAAAFFAIAALRRIWAA